MKKPSIKNFLIACYSLIIASYLFSQPSSTRLTPYSFFEESIDFELPDAQGVLHRSSDYRGKQCIVCFIKSRVVSEQCLLTYYLSQIYPWLQERNIELLGVSTSPLNDNSPEEKNAIPFPILLDYDGSISKHYCTDCDSAFASAPTTFILNKSGTAIKILNPENIGGLIAQIVIHTLSLAANEKNNITTKCAALATKNNLTLLPEQLSLRRFPNPILQNPAS